MYSPLPTPQPPSFGTGGWGEVGKMSPLILWGMVASHRISGPTPLASAELGLRGPRAESGSLSSPYPLPNTCLLSLYWEEPCELLQPFAGRRAAWNPTLSPCTSVSNSSPTLTSQSRARVMAVNGTWGFWGARRGECQRCVGHHAQRSALESGGEDLMGSSRIWLVSGEPFTWPQGFL